MTRIFTTTSGDKLTSAYNANEIKAIRYAVENGLNENATFEVGTREVTEYKVVINQDDICTISRVADNKLISVAIKMVDDVEAPAPAEEHIPATPSTTKVEPIAHVTSTPTPEPSAEPVPESPVITASMEKEMEAVTSVLRDIIKQHVNIETKLCEDIKALQAEIDSLKAQLASRPTEPMFAVTCGGKRTEYPESQRREVIAHFHQAMKDCDGSERLRYVNIYFALIDGKKEITDEE